MDQVGIPGSNMFKIFPLLFVKTKKNHIDTGFEELKAKINEMGLGDYLTSKSMKTLTGGGLPKKQKQIVKPNLSSEAWWYIGP